jgi:hypothetical protein
LKSQDDDNSLIETVEAEAGLEIQIWTSDFQHALEGHPEVTLEKVRTALKNPIKVIKSKKSNRVCLFYSLEVQDEHFGKIYFCVVVGVTGKGRGKMETAYETTYIKDGDVLLEKGGRK